LKVLRAATLLLDFIAVIQAIRSLFHTNFSVWSDLISSQFHFVMYVQQWISP